MDVYNLMLEVTRRCDLACEHCLRGDAENIDLDLDYVRELFKHLDYVSSITFTGGEPALVWPRLDMILEIAKTQGVRVGSFYIATNAAQVNKPFIFSCLKWWVYCDDNEASAVNWSNDPWHKLNQEQVKYLSGLSFAAPKYKEDEKKFYTIAEGRGLMIEGRALDQYGFEVEDGNIIEGELYLNCEGNIISGCDWSYDSQREEEKIVCHVNDFSIEKIVQYNEEKVVKYSFPEKED